MNKDEQISKFIDEALNSLDDVKRAGAKPYLLTRIHARLSEKSESLWEKAGRFVGKPSFAIPGLAMILLINLSVVFFSGTVSFGSQSEQTVQAGTDDFAYTVTPLYEIENIEP